MHRLGRRPALAAVAAAVLLGVGLLAAGDVSAGGGAGAGHQSSGQAAGQGSRAPAVVADPSLVGLTPAVVRERAAFDAGRFSVDRSAPVWFGALAVALVLGSAPIAVACWCLTRTDRRRAPPQRRSFLAPLRAPPLSPRA